MHTRTFQLYDDCSNVQYLIVIFAEARSLLLAGFIHCGMFLFPDTLLQNHCYIKNYFFVNLGRANNESNGNTEC